MEDRVMIYKKRLARLCSAATALFALAIVIGVNLVSSSSASTTKTSSILYRFYNGSDWYYTTSAQADGLPNMSSPATYTIANEAGTTSVPIYRYVIPGTSRRIYSKTATPPSAMWHNEGIAFYGTSSTVVPYGYCRRTWYWLSNSDNRNFYTPFTSDRDAFINNGWTLKSSYAWNTDMPCTKNPQPQRPTSSNPTLTRAQALTRLLHKGGAYALKQDMDLGIASSSNIQLTLTTYGSSSVQLTPANLNRYGVSYIDNYPQQFLYSKECSGVTTGCCPDLGNSCAPYRLDATMMQTLISHIQTTRDDPLVTAHYLLDDSWADFSRELENTYSVIRAVDPAKPTICAFYLDLNYSSQSSASLAARLKEFDARLINYSPHYCNTVAIYAYTPSGQTRIQGAEWDMHSVMPVAINSLVKRGWNGTSIPLIGIPQSFGYDPRTVIRNSITVNTYTVPPTQTELTTQIASFCNFGAQSIIGYVWKDQSVGPAGTTSTITELSNSSSLRNGFTQGIEACKSHSW